MKTVKIVLCLGIAALCPRVTLLQAKELCEVTEQQTTCSQESASKSDVRSETDRVEVAQNSNDSTKDAQSEATSPDAPKADVTESSNQDVTGADFQEIDTEDNES
jgi:hypothetical protein